MLGISLAFGLSCFGKAQAAGNIARMAVSKVKNNQQVYPKHKPYGKGIGAKPGRVVWSHNPKSVRWDVVLFLKGIYRIDH